MYQAKFIKEQSRLILPFGEARYAPIAAEDIGRVVASILAEPEGHAEQVYPLFGPKELTQPEIVAILSDVLGRTITYVPMDRASKPCAADRHASAHRLL
jgi:NAD(P)H dehydrogenase (quinone)